MDRQEILAKLGRARTDIDEVVDAMVDGDQQRVSWTRLLAHNVNNHLTSVFYIIEQFAHGDVSLARQAAYVEGLKEVAERIQETIRRLMTVSQIDNLVRMEVVDFGDVVAEAVDRQKNYASMKAIDLESERAAAEPIMVDADRLGLMESVLNLIGNAIKYSPRNTRIDVTVQGNGNNVEVRVRDQGPGLGPEDRAKLFKVGGTCSTKPTAGEPQTGVGLALSHELVRAMGGTLWCESDVGKGSMFGIRLPLAKPSKKPGSK